ncbi:MAG: hypothetical protein AAFX87_14250 [Bacteroidota bacterium]
MRKILLFELNEVPFRVIDHYCEQFPSSNLARIINRSYQYETLTEDEGHLHPWTTWPTLHRGISNKVHKIKDFGEDLSKLNKTHPPLWQLLRDQGISVGVYGSMHSYPLPKDANDYDFYVPDPFAQTSDCVPKSIEPFQAFNLSMARRSGRNIDSGIDYKSAVKLATKLPGLGIKLKTATSVASQLVQERVSPWKTTRRRTYQSVLAFDVFMKLLKKHKPQFVTYLSNHVAATMHRYWAATFPDDYEKNNLSNEWLQTYAGEIDFAMNKFDEFLGELIPFIDNNPDYMLVVASSMGQEATSAELIKTELALKNFNKFFSKLELSNEDWEQMPAMHPQYNVKVNKDKVHLLVQNLNKLNIKGEPLSFRQKDEVFFSIDFGHVDMEENGVLYENQSVSLEDFGLHNEHVDEEAAGTAYHIPEGSMIIYDPKDGANKQREFRINTTRFAPSILENFEIEVPSYMTDERIEAISGALKAV